MPEPNPAHQVPELAARATSRRPSDSRCQKKGCSAIKNDLQCNIVWSLWKLIKYYLSAA